MLLQFFGKLIFIMHLNFVKQFQGFRTCSGCLRMSSLVVMLAEGMLRKWFYMKMLQKEQLQEFISALRGCELMAQTCCSLKVILENVESAQLHHLLTLGKGFPDVNSVLKHFKDAFDWVQANNSGLIIPHEGVNIEYDSACEKVKEIESHLTKRLQEHRKLLGDKSITCVTIGKDSYLLEMPESLCSCIPPDYELRSSKKGFSRYWTPDIKKSLTELSQAETDKESSLRSILQRLIGRFCEHRFKWRQLVSVTAGVQSFPLCIGCFVLIDFGQTLVD